MIKITIQIDDHEPLEIVEMAHAIVNEGTRVLLPLGMTSETFDPDNGDKDVPLFRIPILEELASKVR